MFVGSYEEQCIDMMDIEAIEKASSDIALGLLVHELEEQFQKQVLHRGSGALEMEKRRSEGLPFGTTVFGAHGAAIEAENEIIGGKRCVSSEKVYEFPYLFPNKTIGILRVEIAEGENVSKAEYKISPTDIEVKVVEYDPKTPVPSPEEGKELEKLREEIGRRNRREIENLFKRLRRKW